METSISYSKEIKTSFLDYSLSVIMSRALPDIRDGLKPVQRRILYAMLSEGMRSTGKFSKCAGVVGEVLKHYHPHGDTAVYDTLVRLIQDWVMRYPMAIGQGNFGSIDGDNAAAYRYTETKLHAFAESLLQDIHLNTVDFVDNYNNTKKEPTVLPSALPNLLVNGSTGIAVGMATNIPPHNLQEIVAACELCIENILKDKKPSVAELMKIIPGPDFPTGGVILGNEGIKSFYETGKGSIVLRGFISTETSKSEKVNLIIKEIPYMVSKAKLIERIATLVRDKKIDGISDLRDESDSSGMRVVVELKKGASPQLTEEQLFKLTPLEQNFSFNMVALVDGIQPKQLGLLEAIMEFLKHRRVVVERRVRFEMEKLKSQIHLLDGQRIVLDGREEYLKKILPVAKNKADLKARIIERFELDETQAETVVQMANYKFTKEEWEEILANLKKLETEYGGLESLLKSNVKLWAQVRKELKDTSAPFNDKRRTSIKKRYEEIETETLIPDHPVVIAMTKDGFIKRYLWDAEKKTDDKNKSRVVFVNDVPVILSQKSSNQNHILLLSKWGQIYRMKAHEIPEMRRYGKGVAITEIIKLKEGDEITQIIDLPKFDGTLAFFSNLGRIKTISLKAIEESNRNTQTVARMKKSEVLVQTLFIPAKKKAFIMHAKGAPEELNLEKFAEWEYGPKEAVGLSFENAHGFYVNDSKGALYKVSEAKPCKTFEPDRFVQVDKDSGIVILQKNDVIFEENVKDIPDGKHSLKAKTFTIVIVPPLFDA